MGLLFQLSLIISIGLVQSRGLLAPQKKGAAPVKAAAAKATPAKEADDDSEDEMMPPMEAFEGVDNDVDADADKQELEAEEDELHSHHPGRMFGVHKEGEKDRQNDHNKVDPMESVHSHRLGSLGEKPSKTKAAPVAAQKPKVAPTKTSHLSSLKDAVGGEEQNVEEKSKPEPKPVPQKPVETANNTEVAVSAETAAQVEKLKAQRKAEKEAAKAPKKVVAPPAPKKPHNLGKDLETVSASDLKLDDKEVAQLKAALPSPKKVSAPKVPVVHEHEHGDAIGRLHAHAKASTETRTTTASAARKERKATPQQLAAARRASSLTDALRNVNASEVKLNLDVSDEAAQRIQAIEAQKKAEADKVEREIEPKKPVDHMADLRATAERELEKKAHHLEVKAAKKVAEKQERPLAKLAEALGEEAATSTTTAAPAKKAEVDPIKALHQRLHLDEPKKVEKPKAAPTPVPQKQTEEPEEEGIMAGFHHNKARDNLPPVLR